MKPSHHDDSGDSHQPDRQTTSDVAAQSRVRYEEQHDYPTKEANEEGDASSPPPHSSTTTTGTTTTPTSEVSYGSPRPSSSASSGSVRGPARPGLSSSIGPNFPHQGTPPPTQHGPASHLLSGHPPVLSEMRTSDESAQWTQETAAAIPQQHVTSSHEAVGASSSSGEPSYSFAIKMLVSNNMAGSIIGRSGQTISELQNQSSTRIKLSQTGDFFPGTQDRVCLVQGDPDNVKKAMSLLLSRVYALQHQNHLQNLARHEEHLQQHDPRATPEHLLGAPDPHAFSFLVRILVPAPCCGMIIGKGGSNIKHMVETSGVTSVRLSPKEGPDLNTDASGTSAALASATAERVVSISGPDLNCCIACLFIIMDGMTSHPELCRYSNMTTSYSRIMSAAYDAAAGRAVMSAPSQDSIHRSMAAPGLWDPNYGPPSHHEPGMDIHGAGSFDAPPMSPYRRSLSGPPSMQTGFSHAPSSPHPFRGHEPVPPYSPMFGGPAAFVPPSPEYQSSPQYQGSPMRGPIPRSHSNTSLPFGAMGLDAPRPPPVSASAPDLLALQFQESLRMSDPHRMDTPSPIYGGPPPQQGFTVQVAIPDSLIGSILGRGGRTLNELQVQSNTRIRISQRGEYVPGTKNRIVTIRGPTAHSVTMAQMLMSQCMVLPPTAISPTTAFPIQPVERAFEQHPQQQGGYMPQSPSSGPRAPPPTADDD